MIIEWDVPITMDDGVVLRADVFRPDDDGRYPVIMSHGPYAKGLSFQEGYAALWANLEAEHPDALGGLVEPLPELGDRRPGEVGARRLRRGARGLPRLRAVTGLPRHLLAAGDPGLLRRASSGRGCSRGATARSACSASPTTPMNQWQVAALQPPHLAAICPWEGADGLLPRVTHHGGILNDSSTSGFRLQVERSSTASGNRAAQSEHGEPVAGPERSTDAELAENRADVVAELRDRPLMDDFYRERTADLRSPCRCCRPPTGAHHLHTRGGFEGYLGVRVSRNGWRCTAFSIGSSSTPTTAWRCRSGSSVTS